MAVNSMHGLIFFLITDSIFDWKPIFGPQTPVSIDDTRIWLQGTYQILSLKNLSREK
jgi:hypothetical protein